MTFPWQQIKLRAYYTMNCKLNCQNWQRFRKRCITRQWLAFFIKCAHIVLVKSGRTGFHMFLGHGVTHTIAAVEKQLLKRDSCVYCLRLSVLF